MNWLKTLLLVLMVSLAGQVLANTERLEMMFAEANEAYKNGDVAQAKELYTGILEEGFESSKLYFNLANCYYKERSYPSALLYYERAKRLAPNDEDVLHNLHIAQLQITDKVEALPTFFLTDYWNGFSLMQSPDRWAAWFIGLLLMACAAFTTFLVARKKSFKQFGFSLSIAVFLLAGICLAAAISAQGILEKPEAIVFDSSVNVKSEPALTATDQFVVHAGLKVEVMQAEEDWARIRLENGNSGWVRIQSIEQI